ncbi:hypothetical protein GIB67_031599 [Kingdonia uniflora]|uniref:Uncharacterized protein n=1 Tax=Kingdonia uniflora TaxID=39325 RepID=A0A7J7LYK7_9MAGN|nr:hypothetical protein GIB67_031599 [Kingdonia uniflora]
MREDAGLEGVLILTNCKRLVKAFTYKFITFPGRPSLTIIYLTSVILDSLIVFNAHVVMLNLNKPICIYL